jgi:MerR family transcriptional regulator, light-induced transcriptional regulator
MDQADISLRSSGASYRSGVAARLAGVPVETLRVWERRYGVIGPSKSSSGQRLYSADDVRRLTLIKQLLDLGHPIGAVATMQTEDLIRMFSALDISRAREGLPAQSSSPTLRLVLVGPTVSSGRYRDSLLRNLSGVTLEIVGYSMTAEGLTSTLKSATANLVIIEMPTLNDGSLIVINRLTGVYGASKAIVLYRFAPSSVIRTLRQAGHSVAHALSDTTELATLCRTLLLLPQTGTEVAPATMLPGKVLPPRFDSKTLAAFAEASSTVYCECPRHLVELVISLTTFERYSAECVSRSPEDVELHRDLQQTAAQARSLIEDAISRVAFKEGLSLRPDV